MSTEFALDLRLARQKSGLTQNDCAHLMAVDQSRLSALEHGRSRPSLEQICMLSIIYGRSFESLFALILEESRTVIGRRLETLPEERRAMDRSKNRDHTINQMRHRVLSPEDHGAA